MTTAPSDRRALAVLVLAGLAVGTAVWLLLHAVKIDSREIIRHNFFESSIV